jgi:hypothetical protein
MDGRELRAVQSSREQALADYWAMRNGPKGEFAFCSPLSKGDVAFDTRAKVPLRGSWHRRSARGACPPPGLFGRGKGNISTELAAGIDLVATGHKEAYGVEQSIRAGNGFCLIASHRQVDGSEVCHEGAVFIDGGVDAGLKGIVSGHERNIINENAMNDAIRPRALLCLGIDGQEIEFEF